MRRPYDLLARQHRCPPYSYSESTVRHATERGRPKFVMLVWRSRLFLPLAGILAGLIAACGQAPRPVTYSIPVTEAEIVMSRPPIEGVLMVEAFSADDVLAGRKLAWRAGPEDLEIRTYAYHSWNESPPRLLQTHLRTCLDSGNIASSVVVPSDRVQSDYILGGTLRHFEQQKVGDGGAVVDIAVDIYLAERRSRRILWRQPLTIMQGVANQTPEAAVDGFIAGLDDLCDLVLTTIAEHQ